MDPSEEKKLVQEARTDPVAFGHLYELHFDSIFNYVFRRVSDFDLARDITSEVFVKAYRKFWQFQWKNISIGAWFYRIATNEVNQFFRNSRYGGNSNFLAITHFYVDRELKEFNVTIKLRWINILVLLLCLAVFTILFGYLIIENINHS